MGTRTWIKIYPDKWLDGSLRDEPIEVRGAWIDLLAMAGSGRFGDKGEIKINETIGFSVTDFARLLNISVRQFQRIRSKLVAANRISCDKNGVITVLNWSKYQSEYDRQRQYRVTTKVTPEVTPGVITEKEKEKEKENIFDLFEKYFGRFFTSLEAEELKQLEYEYCLKWIEAAFKESAERDKRDLRYARAILGRWARDNKPGEETVVEAAREVRW